MRSNIKRKISTKEKLCLLVLGLVLCLFTLEAGLRIGGYIFLFIQERRNASTLEQKGAYRIMCLGESTTALGGEDSYPSQLEDVLNQRGEGVRFSVINKGVPGTRTLNIALTLDENIEKYRPHMIITMMGANDGGDYTISSAGLFATRIRFSITSFKTCKLAKLLWLHMAENEYIKNMMNGPFNSRGHKNTVDDLSVPHNIEREEAYISSGFLCIDRGEYEQAGAFFRRVMHMNPGNAAAYIGLGECFAQRGRYERAEEILTGYLENRPEDINVRAILSDLYCRQDKFAEAEKALQRNLDMAGDFFWLYDKMANCCEAAGKKEMAERYFRKARAIEKVQNSGKAWAYDTVIKTAKAKGIEIICAQYALCKAEDLKDILNGHEDVPIVDNKGIFEKALEEGGYEEYFTDRFGGHFGHCTRKGNRLLAENIAEAVLKLISGGIETEI